MSDIVFVLSVIVGLIAVTAILFYVIAIGFALFIGISDAIKRNIDRDRRNQERTRRRRERR